MSKTPMYRVPKAYLQLDEIADRWRVPEIDIRRAVLAGLLRPSLFLDGVYQVAQMGQDGTVTTGETEPVRATGFRYASFFRQVAPFDLVCQTVTLTANCELGDEVLVLPSPMHMQDLFEHAVVLLDDLERAEVALRGRPKDELKFNEEVGLLKVLSVALTHYCHYSPGDKDGTLEKLFAASEKQGISVSRNTIRKYADMAVSHYPPVPKLLAR